MRRRALFALAALFCASTAAASSIDVTTYYDSPNADYRDLKVTGALTAGLNDANMGPLSIDGGAFTAAFFGPLSIVSNGIMSRWATSRGGWLTIAGDLNVTDEGGTSLFYVNTTDNRVGIGTTTPARTLDVRGAAKAESLFAYMDTFDNYQPYTEMWSENNGVARFSATYFDYTAVPQRARYCTLHIDGDPLCMQTAVKGDNSYQGLGRGQVAIKGENGGYATPDAKIILVVGEPFASVGPPGYYPDTATPPQAYAHEWYQFSSREYKKDIVPLGAAEYPALLEQLARTPVVRFRYKQEPPSARPHLGFIAEDAPADIVDASGKGIDLGEEAAFLMAAAKSLKEENASLRARVERLKK